MSADEKSSIRTRFRIAAFVFLAASLAMAFLLALLEKDVTAFGVVTGTLAAPITGLLVADYATTPKGN